MRLFSTLFGALALGLAALAAVPAAAQTSPFAAGVNIGTPGVGGEIEFQAARVLVLRGTGDWLQFDHDATYGGIPYKGRLKSATGGAFADWHPTGGGFLVSAGAYFGQRRIELSSAPAGNIVVGGQTFTPAQIGRLEGTAKLSNTQPFVGLGYDNTFAGERRWGFRGLVGVSFSDAPRVNLTSVGSPFSNDPVVQAALRREEALVQHDVRDWRYYPIAQIGVTRRF